MTNDLFILSAKILVGGLNILFGFFGFYRALSRLREDNWLRKSGALFAMIIGLLMIFAGIGVIFIMTIIQLMQNGNWF